MISPSQEVHPLSRWRLRLSPAVQFEAAAVAFGIAAWIYTLGASSWMLRVAYSESSWIFLFGFLGITMIAAASITPRPIWYVLLMLGCSVYAGLGVIASRNGAPAESCVFFVNVLFLFAAFWQQRKR